MIVKDVNDATWMGLKYNRSELERKCELMNTESNVFECVIYWDIYLNENPYPILMTVHRDLDTKECFNCS